MKYILFENTREALKRKIKWLKVKVKVKWPLVLSSVTYTKYELELLTYTTYLLSNLVTSSVVCGNGVSLVSDKKITDNSADIIDNPPIKK